MISKVISKEEQEINYNKFLKKVEGILEVDEKYRHVHSSDSLRFYRRGWTVNARNMRLPDALYLSTEIGRMNKYESNGNFKTCGINGLLIKPFIGDRVEFAFITIDIGNIVYEQDNISEEDLPFCNYLKLLSCTKLLHCTVGDGLHNVENSGGKFKHDPEKLKDIINEPEINSFVSLDKRVIFSRKNVILRDFKEFDADVFCRHGKTRGYKIVFSINNGDGEIYFSVIPKKDICLIGIRNCKAEPFYTRSFNMETSYGTFMGLFNYFTMMTNWKPDMGTVGETTYEDIFTEMYARWDPFRHTSQLCIEENLIKSQYTYLYETDNFYKSVEENIECVIPAFENSYKDIRDTRDPIKEEE